MEKIVNLGEKSVRLKATGALPRLYRMLFLRDIFKDLAPMVKRNIKIAENPKFQTGEALGEEEQMGLLENMGDNDLEVMENLTYAMAKAGNPEMKEKNVEDWLDQFSYQEAAILQKEALTLWLLDNYTIAESKKKIGQ